MLDPDSLSINTDTSALTASTTGTSGASLEMVPTKESILSRFSALSRKGSTSKFNISWKKEKSEKEKENKDKDKDEGLISGSGLLDPSSTISPPSATPTSRHLWQPWKKAESDVSADEKDHKEEKEKKDKKKEKEKDEDKDGSSALSAKEGSSPWLKSTQSAGTFFGTIGRRKVTEKKEDDAAAGGSEADDDLPTPTVEQPSEKKGLGIFGRRKTEKKEEKADKIEEVIGEA